MVGARCKEEKLSVSLVLFSSFFITRGHAATVVESTLALSAAAIVHKLTTAFYSSSSPPSSIPDTLDQNRLFKTQKHLTAAI